MAGRNSLMVLLLLVFCSATPARAGELNWSRLHGAEGADHGGFVDEMHGVVLLLSEDGEDHRLFFGDRFGQVHALRLDKGRFTEEWVSEPLRSTIAEVFVEDIDSDGQPEIVAYTESGDIAFYSTDDYRRYWRSSDNIWASISAMVVADIDDDPQMELVFCAERAEDVAGYRSRAASPEDAELQREIDLSRLHFFDCLNEFVEWESEAGVHGRSIAIGDLDADGNLEVITNAGFVVDAVFRSVDWRYAPGFGQRIGYADIDGDGIPELIGEFRSLTHPRRTLRFFDVDLQSESFLSTQR